MGNLHKNIQLMLVFLRLSLLVVHFAYYILMTLPVMLFSILLSMLMTLISIQSGRLQIQSVFNLNSTCFNLNLNTLWTGLEMTCWFQYWKKLNWFHLTGWITVVLSIWRWMGLICRKNDLLICWIFFFFLIGLRVLHWLYYFGFITSLKKIEAWICCMKFLPPEAAVYLYKSSLRSCMKTCYHTCADSPSCYLDTLKKL